MMDRIWYSTSARNFLPAASEFHLWVLPQGGMPKRAGLLWTGILPDLNDFIECALCIKAAGGIDTSCPFIYSRGLLCFGYHADCYFNNGFWQHKNTSHWIATAQVEIFGENHVSDFVC